MSLKVLMKRVKKGDLDTKVVDKCVYVRGVVPEDGFIIKNTTPGDCPMYIRNSDLEKMNNDKNSDFVQIVSWDEK